jgi:sulfite reductase beta subunit-like hemoprotein
VLHRAQDGWLARVRIPGGRVTPDQLVALSRAASIGNGLVELTSRANLQLRGFRTGAAEELVAIIGEVGLLPSAVHDRARNVIASPVAGRHPSSRGCTDAVVESIDRGVCADGALAELPGRFRFAVDDGSGTALDRFADVVLICRAGDSYSLALAGQATADTLPAADAATVAVAAAAAFLSERKARGVDAWRIGELDQGAAAIARRIGTEIAGPLDPPSENPLAPGRLEQRDGRVALTGLAPLGRLDGRDLARLAEVADEVRVGTARTVTVLDVDPAAVAAIEARLASLGLVLQPASGWVGLSACAGLGRCPQARIDVRSAAMARARTRRPAAAAEHWAACERRCGERADQPIAMVAVQDGVAVRSGESEWLVADAEDAIAVLAG